MTSTAGPSVNVVPITSSSPSLHPTSTNDDGSLTTANKHQNANSSIGGDQTQHHATGGANSGNVAKKTPTSRFSQQAPTSGGNAKTNNRPASQMFLANASHPMPDAEQIDQWFESLSEFEDMLEDMAQVSLDPVFKDELNAIDQWFTVLSDAERTAALYSLLQHASDVQVRFFITILQQMATRGSQKDQVPQRHSVAVTGGVAAANGASGAATGGGNIHNRNDPRYARMSYDGPLVAGGGGSVLDKGDGTNGQMLGGVAAGNGGINGQMFSNRNWSVENLSTDPGVLGGGGVAIGANRANSQGGRPQSAHGVDQQNLNWRNSRASVASLDGTGGNVVHPGELAPPSQRGSMLGGASRQSFMDWEPKNFRWSSLSESLEPYGNVGPDPNAIMFAQRLEQQMTLSGSRGVPSNRNSMNNRQSINSRLSVMVQDPRSGSVSSPLQSPRKKSMPTKSNNPSYPPGLVHPTTGASKQAAWSNAPSANNGVNMTPSSSNTPRGHQYQQQQQHRRISQNNAGGSNRGPQPHSPTRGQHNVRQNRATSPNPGAQQAAAAAAAAKPQDEVDFELLKDIPAWMRSLRLHKYNNCFEGMTWKEMIVMTDEQLTNRGVAALGARRKMLKVFENVKDEYEKRQAEGIPV